MRKLYRHQVRRAYIDGKIGLSDAMRCLMLDFAMDRGDALRYLGL
jgi:hypothetical protein